LLDERTFSPRPIYWGALLWRELMGAAVLDAAVPSEHGLHVYAHSLRGSPGGVAVLAINNDHVAPRALRTPVACRRYTLSALELQGHCVLLNGSELGLGADGGLPRLEGVETGPGVVMLAPATITFLAFPRAGLVARPSTPPAFGGLRSGRADR